MEKVAALLQQLNAGDDAMAEEAACELARHQDSALVPLLSLLEAEDPDQRWWATRVLAAFKAPVAVQGLQKAIRDPEPAIRQCAALGLRLAPSTGAIPALVDALHDADRLVARLAGDALAAAGTPAIQALESALQSPQPDVRIEAARALAGIQDPQAIPILYAALEDPSMLVSYWAEEGLARLGVGWVFIKP